MKFNPFSEGRPTGTCFDDAAEFLVAMFREHAEYHKRKDVFLVHALCRAEDGEFSHAWVEVGKMAYHAQIDNNGNKAWLELPKYILYRFLKVKKTWKYTPYEAYQQDRANPDNGPPWVPELKILCKDKRKSEDSHVPKPG